MTLMDVPNLPKVDCGYDVCNFSLVYRWAVPSQLAAILLA